MDVFGESMSDEWSSALSPRQREVALLVARGLANKEIARELGLSEGTVKQHVHSIFLKLHTRKRNTLVLLANERAIAQSRIPRSLLEFPKYR